MCFILCALMQSDCLYLSVFFEHYNRVLLGDWVLGHCSVCSFESVSWHNAFEVYLVSTSLGISILLCCSVLLKKCYEIANYSMKNVSVTLLFASNAAAKRSVKNVSLGNPVNHPQMPLWNVLFHSFLSTCIVKKADTSCLRIKFIIIILRKTANFNANILSLDNFFR